MTRSLKHYGIVEYDPSMTHWSAEDAYEWDATQVRAGIAIETLMDRAGKQVARVLSNHYTNETPFVVFVGKGNNGGDGIVASRYLVSLGYKVRLICLYPIEECTALVQTQLELWIGMGYPYEVFSDEIKVMGKEVVIDAILGIGLKDELRAKELACIELIRREACAIWSIDLPSGCSKKGGVDRCHLISIQAPKNNSKGLSLESHFVADIS